MLKMPFQLISSRAKRSLLRRTMSVVSHILPKGDSKKMDLAVEGGYVCLMLTAIGVFVITVWIITESAARTRLVILLLVSMLEYMIFLFVLDDTYFAVFLLLRAMVCGVHVLDCCEPRRRGRSDDFLCVRFVLSCFGATCVAFGYHAEEANFISFMASLYSVFMVSLYLMADAIRLQPSPRRQQLAQRRY